MTPTQLLAQLVAEGGAIVTSNECSTLEISDAQCTGRFAVDEDGIGYVRRYKEWIDLQKTREGSDPIKDISIFRVGQQHNKWLVAIPTGRDVAKSLPIIVEASRELKQTEDFDHVEFLGQVHIPNNIYSYDPGK